MRVTRAALHDEVMRLQESGFNISIQWAYGKPRCFSLDGSRELSPRLSTGEMAEWLNGVWNGIRLESEHARAELAKQWDIDDPEYWSGWK